MHCRMRSYVQLNQIIIINYIIIVIIIICINIHIACICGVYFYTVKFTYSSELFIQSYAESNNALQAYL